MTDEDEEMPQSPPLMVSRVLGWIVMGLAMFGGPVVRALNRVFNGALPTDLHIRLIVGLLALGALVWVGWWLWKRGENRPNAPMPPFGGGGQPWRRPAQPSQPAAQLPPSLSQQQLSAPRFDPLIDRKVLVGGAVGLVLIGALALALLAGGML
ncbi:MAG TPA: hypothetical protein VFS21_05820 [Roseiflexaceae bacterium]|nr:hypothetical protein [Roseiflexaceae bacterium]